MVVILAAGNIGDREMTAYARAALRVNPVRRHSFPDLAESYTYSKIGSYSSKCHGDSPASKPCSPVIEQVRQAISRRQIDKIKNENAEQYSRAPASAQPRRRRRHNAIRSAWTGASGHPRPSIPRLIFRRGLPALPIVAAAGRPGAAASTGPDRHCGSTALIYHPPPRGGARRTLHA